MRLRGLSKGMLSGFSCFSSSSCLGRVSWWSKKPLLLHYICIKHMETHQTTTMLHQKQLGLKRSFREGNAGQIRTPWAPQHNVLITRPDKRSIDSLFCVYRRCIICSTFCWCINTKNACCDMTKITNYMDLDFRRIKVSLWLPNTCEDTRLTVELSAVHGFRHVWCQSREFAEGQQGFLLAEVPSLCVGLTVQGTMGLSWREEHSKH